MPLRSEFIRDWGVNSTRFYRQGDFWRMNSLSGIRPPYSKNAHTKTPRPAFTERGASTRKVSGDVHGLVGFNQMGDHARIGQG